MFRQHNSNFGRGVGKQFTKGVKATHFHTCQYCNKVYKCEKRRQDCNAREYRPCEEHK